MKIGDPLRRVAPPEFDDEPRPALVVVKNRVWEFLPDPGRGKDVLSDPGGGEPRGRLQEPQKDPGKVHVVRGLENIFDFSVSSSAEELHRPRGGEINGGRPRLMGPAGLKLPGESTKIRRLFSRLPAKYRLSKREKRRAKYLGPVEKPSGRKHSQPVSAIIPP